MLIVRHIQTQPKREKGKLVRRDDGTPVVEPVLDANGQEVELWRVEVPTEVELQEREIPGAIDAYVSAELAKVRQAIVGQLTAAAQGGADVLINEDQTSPVVGAITTPTTSPATEAPVSSGDTPDDSTSAPEALD